MAAPKGNKNAVGNRGGAPKGNTNALKHGGYAKIFWEDLTLEENAMVFTTPTDPEELLFDQIKLLTVREYRIMRRIAQLSGIESGLAVDSVIRSEDKRQFADKEEKALYDERIAEKVEAGDRLPGHPYHVQTRTDTTQNIILHLEEVLTRIQDEKRRAIESLIRLQRKDGLSLTMSLVNDWVTAVFEADVEVD